MIQQEIIVKVSFEKHTLIKKDPGVVQGDYNTTKFIFEFEEDTSAYSIVFKMSDPNGNIVLLSELTDNEIVLAGWTDEGEVYSLFAEVGLYPFELIAYGENSKITSAPGFLTVNKRQIPLDGGGETGFYLPLGNNLVFNDTVTGDNYELFFESGKLKFEKREE